jgi:selenocysteine-specific translation elongation factor
MLLMASKNLTVGVFHDDALAGEIAKKGTISDIQMFNRKTDDCIFTFMLPARDKLAAKAQIMSCTDAAVVSFVNMTPEVGETILMLNALGIKKGVCIVPTGTDICLAIKLTRDTSLESFVVKPRDALEIMATLEKIDIVRDVALPVLVSIDHSFAVKGVGEVMLGFVKRGVVRKHDKLMLMPAGKEVVVRSIQMHDKDFDSADAGSRVGLVLKGASIDELKRGAVLCAPGSVKTGTRINLSFEKNKFYTEQLKEGTFHVSVGMQAVPVKVSDITENSLVIEAEKPLVYTTHEVFLLLDLNAKKLHVMGKGLAL